MRNDLQYNLCSGCGEISPEGQGILAIIQHCCSGNTITYRPGSFRLRHLKQLMGGEDDMQPFKDLLHFQSFGKMKNIETATYMEKFIYSAERDLDIRAMKRLRAYIELEEDLNSKY